MAETRLIDVITHLKRPRVLVIGDLLLDQYLFGAVHRISPEAPIPVLHVGREEYRAGGAANVAWNLASLRARVSCIGTVGRDEHGTILTKLMRKAGVDTRIIVDSKKPTSTKTRVIAQHQHVVRIDREHADSIHTAVGAALSSKIKAASKKADIIVMSDYQKGTLSSEVCKTAIKTGLPVIVGLKGTDMMKFKGATGAALNQSELYALSGNTRLKQSAREIVRKLKLKFLIVTLGEKGLAVFPREGADIHLPTQAQQVYDVTGAGDTVLSAFALAYASGASLSDCARIGNIAAGIVVGKIGTASATRLEITQHIRKEELSHVQKIMGERELLRRLKMERERGHSIVFTNGCFDVVHLGHIKLLQFAKTQGDILVVGLNGDESIRRLKGARRPIVDYKGRAHVLSALEAVDAVVRFDSDTPLALIKKIRPDVLVKGGDWAKKSVVGRAYAKRVVLVPLAKGYSTTNIIERIVERHN